jgi:hypothetical protein
LLKKQSQSECHDHDRETIEGFPNLQINFSCPLGAASARAVDSGKEEASKTTPWYYEAM